MAMAASIPNEVPDLLAQENRLKFVIKVDSLSSAAFSGYHGISPGRLGLGRLIAASYLDVVGLA